MGTLSKCLILFAFVFLLDLQVTVFGNSNHDKDCMYNRCVWKFDKRITHVPCGSTPDRYLVRSIDCADGNTFHICCKPLRNDIRKSRQKWFLAVAKIGELLSRACTKRILCEQSCLDGLRGSGRTDYPQILNGDSDLNEEYTTYVQAYFDGENLACYNLAAKEKPHLAAYDPESCKEDCALKHGECQADLDTNFAVECYYASSRLFHKLGLWFFTAFNMNYDTVRDGARKAVTVRQTIKKAFTDLYQRMATLEKAYKDWLATEFPGNNRKVNHFEQDNRWKRFLVSFNRTDLELVDNLFESLNRTQFSGAIGTINHTLVTTDFGPGQWNGVLSSRIQWSTMMLITFALLLFVIVNI